MQEEDMKKGMLAGSLAVAVALAGALALAGPGFAEKWEHERGERHPRGLTAVKDPKVLKECGSCHMAFLPGFLPGKSWEKIMGNLKEHFGDNATLDEATAREITEYLVANASDGKASGKAAAPAKESAAEPVIRISELGWFKSEHSRRITPESLKRHKAKSKSDCKACHPSADKGFFDDD
jgi:hypothetical protein